MLTRPRDLNTTDGKAPSYVRPELASVLMTLQLIDDLCENPLRMWERSKDYIPKWSKEDPDIYNRRRLGEPCFGGLKRTVMAGTGMLCGSDPQITWNAHEARMRVIGDNIDGMRTKINVFLAQTTFLSLKHGFAVLLIDHPKAPRNPDKTLRQISLQEEEELGLMPRVALYPRTHVLNWFTKTLERNNKTEISRLVLFEPGTEEDGDYGVKELKRYRVLRLLPMTSGGYIAIWRLLQEVKVGGKITYEQVDAGVFTNRAGELATRLPIAVTYTSVPSAPLVADIPLVNVAYANLSYWQYKTDLKFNRSVCGFEQPVITGDIAAKPRMFVEGQSISESDLEEEGIDFGPMVGVHLKQGGTFNYAGPTGKGLEQLEKGANEAMKEMDQQGLGFLLPRTTVKTTATESRITSYAQLSTLATSGKGIQDGINTMWEWVGWYDGVPAEQCPVLTINTDFESNKMDPQTMLAYLQLVQAGFPKRLVLIALQEGGRIPEDEDLEKLQMEWDAELALRQAAMAPTDDDEEDGDTETDDGADVEPMVA